MGHGPLSLDFFENPCINVDVHPQDSLPQFKNEPIEK